MEFRKATSKDIIPVKELLSSVDLYYQDVPETIDNCIIATNGSKIIGTAALECLGKYALLKSFAVSPEYQGKGIGRTLFQNILSLAYKNKVEQLFLLTNTAKNYFLKLNFKTFDRNNVPEPIKKTREFQSLCPSTATCMSLKLDHIMHYYPKNCLELKSDIEGVKLWGVSLQNTQFTYFEVDPNKEFEMHNHESEQITYILEGELYFKTDTETICVKAGEAIAIPSNLRHGAFTREKALRAVDAWSPINVKYD